MFDDIDPFRALQVFALVLSVIVSIFAIFFLSGGSVPLSGFTTYEKNPIDGQVTMTQNIDHQLRDRWYKEESVGGLEYAYCVETRRVNGAEEIYKISEVHYSKRTKTQVDYSVKNCQGGILHPHFNGVCKASAQDYYTFGKLGQKISVVQCGPERFRGYTPDKLGGFWITPSQ